MQMTFSYIAAPELYEFGQSVLLSEIFQGYEGASNSPTHIMYALPHLGREAMAAICRAGAKREADHQLVVVVGARRRKALPSVEGQRAGLTCVLAARCVAPFEPYFEAG